MASIRLHREIGWSMGFRAQSWSAGRVRNGWLRARLCLPVLVALATSATVPAAAHAGVMAWGSNRFFQLGSESSRFSDVPVSLSGLGQVKQVVASNGYSLALLSNGEVWAWGVNHHGQLGDGSAFGREVTSVPVQVSGISEATAISATHGYSLALLRDGRVMAWGGDEDGRMGNGLEGWEGDSDTPEPVQGLTKVTAISAGQFHALALLENGTVMAWGNGQRGSLGDGEGLLNSDVPVPVEGITEAVAVGAGNVHSIVLLKNGKVLAFGANEFGQLGDGGKEKSYVPVPVSGLSEVTAIAAGGWQNLALLRNGTVMAWGWNKSGELGTGTRTGPERCGQWSCAKVPHAVSELSEVTEISAASNTFVTANNLYGLALRKNGTVMAWGGNEDGQLGDDSKATQYAPVEVQGLSGVTGISAGGYDSLAVTAE